MFVILSGVSGAGKDTVMREILKRMDNVEFIASYTSREQRDRDIPGQTYNFVSREKFEQMIKNDEFYEYDVHHENYYGTSKKLLNEKISKGKIIIKDIDVNGTENLVKILKNDIKIITIFLRVPKAVLRKRIEQREEGITPEEIDLRLSRFEYEESKIPNYDYVIKNNNLEKTVNIIMSIIENEYNSKSNEF